MLQEHWRSSLGLVPDSEQLEMVAIRGFHHLLLEVETKPIDEFCKSLEGIWVDPNLKILQIEISLVLSLEKLLEVDWLNVIEYLLW